MRPRTLGFALLLSAAIPAAAQASTAPPEPNDSPEVVVTAQRIQDFRDRLAQCLARHCPVNEDVDATLALAEAEFLNGDYAGGRSDVRASLARNRDQAHAFPEPVSDLWRASARLDRHIGHDRDAQMETFQILRALQAGIPQEDHRHFTARLEIAENQMASGNLSGARRALAELARTARAAGREDVAQVAELRDASYQLMAFPTSDARARLVQWSRSTEPTGRMRRIGASLILARLYRSEGNVAASDALLAEVSAFSRSGAHRNLIYQPDYQLAQRDPNAGQQEQTLTQAIAFGSTLNRVTENYESKWIDVGFWVLPNGRVSDLQIVRRGASEDWANPLLDSIRGRIYSQSAEPSYRLERYTMTAAFDTTTGSRIQRRGPGARAEYLDLTASGADAPPPPTPPVPSGSTP